jgi:undecaprenyl diphosphate synthase
LCFAIQNSEFRIQNLSEQSFARFLDTAGMPDPDLIIRTGGEFRLSGYFPWQSVYSELYFTKTLWPEFTPGELDKALKDYSERERRFGGGGNKKK